MTGRPAAAHPHLAGADPDHGGLPPADPRRDSGAGAIAAIRSTPPTRPCSSRSRGWWWMRASSFVDLKATLSHFARRFFAADADVRFHPSFFPFTEPSADMSVRCTVCGGSGCPTCKQRGWMEILGSGMVHPAVLENCGDRRRALHGVRLRHGAASHRDAALRHPRHPAVLRERRALPDASSPGANPVNLSRRWLEALLGRAARAREQVAALLTAALLPVEAIEPLHGDLGDVLVARVLEVKPHPNADRLRLCLVDAGGAADRSTSCAARPTSRRARPIRSRRSAPTLPGGVRLERRKIRGVESNGMLCSARELGLGAGPGRASSSCDTRRAPGTRFLDAVPIADDRIVLEVYANRPDLLCHKGVARELGAAARGGGEAAGDPGGARSGRGSQAIRPTAGRQPPGYGGRRRGPTRGSRRRAALHDRGDPRRPRGPEPRVAGRSARGDRAALDQQRRGRDQLHPVRAEPAAARVRSRQAARPGRGGATGAPEREDRHARRRASARSRPT